MSKLVQKFEENKKRMWADRLGVRKYVDNKFIRSRGNKRVREMRALLEEWTASSATVYVGNLSFGHPVLGSTTEEQIYDLYSRCGDVKRVVMGLDRHTHEPCGFAFVEFYERKSCEASVQYLSGTKLDGQALRNEIDRGHIDEEPDRKFGRSASGGQVRDQINRDRGVVNLRRLSSKDAGMVGGSPHFRPPEPKQQEPVAAIPLASPSAVRVDEKEEGEAEEGALWQTHVAG
jgi:nuclear cap-binding protein subunit 2